MVQRQGVFKDETKLDINFVPSRLPHREHQLRLLKEFFSFALKTPEKMTQRVVITGDVGTGKTALSQRFGADVAHEANVRGIRLRYVHVNCREYRGSFFFILQHIISVFHPNFPKRGYSAEELLHMLVQVLDDEKTHMILSLDEFDSLVEKEGPDAVYKLTRLQEMRQREPQRLSLICILRGLETLGKLDASTKSSLQSNVITLQRYSRKDLADILNDRINLAFKPSAVPEETVNLVSELAYSENGNARFAIELLWRAGKYADAEDLGTVLPDCVRKAASSIIPTVRKSDVMTLGMHEKLLLLAIARLLKENEGATVALADAERAYAIACEEFDASPYSHTQLWKYVKDFANLGIIETKVSGTGSRGRSTEISLPRIPAQELENEIEAILSKVKRR